MILRSSIGTRDRLTRPSVRLRVRPQVGSPGNNLSSDAARIFRVLLEIRVEFYRLDRVPSAFGTSPLLWRHT